MAIEPSLLVCSPTLQCAYVDKNGRPLSGGTVTLYKNNSRTGVLKNWYYQSGSPGAPGIPDTLSYLPLPNPMTLSAAGTVSDLNGNDVLPMFYPVSELDNSTPETYFIIVRNACGQIQFTRYNFPFGPDSTSINPVATLENYIINNRFWRNISGAIDLSILTDNFGQAYNSSGNYYYKTLCPSQSHGFSMPDINFIRNANDSTAGRESCEFKTFPVFNPANPPVLPGDITPEFYILHTCNSDDSGAGLKVYQIPLTFHIATLSDVDITFSLQAQANTGNPQLTVRLYQFLGTGVVSPPPIPIGEATIVPTSAWQKYTLSMTTPTNAGITLSPTGDDAFYIQIQVGSTTGVNNYSVSFALPSVYLSPEEDLPTNDFKTYDQIDSVTTAPRTGDIRTSINAYYPFGWLPMSDGVIALANPNNAPNSARANVDTWPLYNLLWNYCKPYDSGMTFNPICQMYTTVATPSPALVPADYGSSAFLDFTANKQLQLTASMGQVFMGTVPMSALTRDYMQVFTATQQTSVIVVSGTAHNPLTVTMSTPFPFYFGQVFQFTTTGTLPGNIAALTNYYAVPVTANTMHLSTSLANAQNNVFVSYTSAGTGTQTINSQSLILKTTESLNLFRGDTLTFKNTLGALPAGLSANVIYYAIPSSATTFGVSLTFNDALNGVGIAYTDAGTGTNTVFASLSGSKLGEAQHALNVSELAAHTHRPTTRDDFGFENFGGTSAGQVLSSAGGPPAFLATNFTAPQGASQPHNTIQSSTFMNIFIKL